MKAKVLFLILCTFKIFATYQAKDFSPLLEKKIPGFSRSLLEMHLTLYKGYVTNTNKLLQALEDEEYDDSIVYLALKRRFGWEYDGMYLHELYFENIGGRGSLSKNSPLYRQIERDFGNYPTWEANFKGIGMMRGVGWVVLCRDPIKGKLYNIWIEEHDLGQLAGADPILVMDVWEHAYITEYGLKRKSYIDAFFNVIDWDAVSLRRERSIRR